MMKLLMIFIMTLIMVTGCGVYCSTITNTAAGNPDAEPSATNETPEAEQISFEPGVAFEFPKGADDEEEAVFQLVKKNIEAIATKNKAVFRATLESDEDYLDFFIDTDKKYRFSELVYIAPFDEEVARSNNFTSSEP
jgi:hypothetical protein